MAATPSVARNGKNNKQEYIIWCDVETTGTNADVDDLLEIGAVVTDMAGNQVGRGFSEIIQVADVKAVMDKCDDHVTKMHNKSGLFEHLWYGDGVSIQKVEDLFIEWLESSVPDYSYTDVCSKDSNFVFYFGGRSITLDRNFLSANTPRIFNIFSHQSIDMTSISIMLARNISYIDKCAVWGKDAQHRALGDCEDCVEQYKQVIESLNNFAHLSALNPAPDALTVNSN